MRRSGGAVILMRDLNVKYLVGGPIGASRPLPPYDGRVCNFLAELSRALQRDRRTALYPDLLSFAFFCRKANIMKLKKEFEDGRVRLGKGLAFHIAPSNVPVNCAFTYVFGLLAGNANIVRVPSGEPRQIILLCDIMRAMLADEKYNDIWDRTAFITYGHDEAVNDALSARADVRVIWGGNETISKIRQSPIKPRCTEITFADRYSFALIAPEAVADADDDELRRLAERFYNETYLMDQNACSTPHLIIWFSEGGEKAKAGKQRFWEAVCQTAEKYDLADIKVSDKYVMLCRYAIELEDIESVQRFENLLYVVTLQELPDIITRLRGRFGLFFQYDIRQLEELARHIDETVQTCTCYGVDQEAVRNFAVNHGLRGIDRVVPVGSALDIGVIWDGYDIVRQMSRIIG